MSIRGQWAEYTMVGYAYVFSMKKKVSFSCVMKCICA